MNRLKSKNTFVFIASLAVVGLIMGAPLPARATTLLDLIDAPSQTGTPYNLSFTASGSSTTISIGGYQQPSHEYVYNIGLFLGGAGSNLLGSSWAFTAAPSGSATATYSDGTSVPAINFSGTTVGSYDTYSQTIATIVGDSYSLDFLYTNNSSNSPSGLRVTTTGTVSAVPVPTALPLFATGLGALGLLGWRRKRKTLAA